MLLLIIPAFIVLLVIVSLLRSKKPIEDKLGEWEERENYLYETSLN